MGKRILFTSILLLLCLSILVGCDPHYPMGRIKVARIKPMYQGDSIDIEISYPNRGGSKVIGWKDHNIEIVSGDDVIFVEGFIITEALPDLRIYNDIMTISVTGLKSGVAVIRVSSTTIISDEKVEAGGEERIYSTREIKIRVKCNTCKCRCKC